MRFRLAVVALSACFVCGCGEDEPTVTSAGPDGGPYGTLVTIQGSALGGELGRIVFENGVLLPHGSELVQSWNDSKIVFRMPTPGAGRYRIEGPELSLDAGRFEPTPWQPRALSLLDDSTDRLDWVPLSEELVVQAVRVNGLLELRFFGSDEDAIQTVDVDVRSAKLVAVGADSVSGFFFEPGESAVFGAFAATRGAVEVVTATPPSSVEALLTADRDENGSYAWLSDSAHRLSKWQLVDGELVEVLSVEDPADESDAAALLSVRGQHTWRTWATNNERLSDSEYTIFAAYLAPDADEFDAALDLGSGDDDISLFHEHGVSLNGEVAVDACGSHDGVLGGVDSCVAAAASPDGVLASEEGDFDEARPLYAAFDTGIATFDCTDQVLGLQFPGSNEAEPLLAPCGSMLALHRSDAAGIPSFAYPIVVPQRSAERMYVLSKY